MKQTQERKGKEKGKVISTSMMGWSATVSISLSLGLFFCRYSVGSKRGDLNLDLIILDELNSFQPANFCLVFLMVIPRKATVDFAMSISSEAIWTFLDPLTSAERRFPSGVVVTNVREPHPGSRVRLPELGSPTKSPKSVMVRVASTGGETRMVIASE